MSYTQAALQGPCSLQSIPAAHPWKQILSSCVSMWRASLWPCSFNHFDESSVSFTIYFISSWEIYSFPTSVTYQLLGNKGLCHYSFHASNCQSTCACLFPTFSFKRVICPELHLRPKDNLSYAPNAPCALLSQKCAFRSVLQRRPWPQQMWSSSCLQAKWMWSILCLLI